MRVILSEVELNVRVNHDVSGPVRAPLVCLHGMTLSGRDWEPFMEEYSGERTIIAPDLIGHGNSSAPDSADLYTVDALVSQLIELLDELGIQSADWVGYSMGGRILLHLVLEHPNRVDSMVLESTTAGIEGETRRQKRREKDARLAEYLEENGLEAFVDRWLDAPIFESQQSLPDDKRQWARETRLEGDPTGLAHCLRELSRGKVTSVWDRLDNVRVPGLLVTGTEDSKHVRIHNRMGQELAHFNKVLVQGAGHNVHFEKPGEFREVLHQFEVDGC